MADPNVWQGEDIGSTDEEDAFDGHGAHVGPWFKVKKRGHVFVRSWDDDNKQYVWHFIGRGENIEEIKEIKDTFTVTYPDMDLNGRWFYITKRPDGRFPSGYQYGRCFHPNVQAEPEWQTVE